MHANEFRSDSEDGIYVSVVKQALKSQKSFENFKRSYSYQKVLEHVTKKQGEFYLKILESRDDQILNLGLESVLKSDEIGNPVKYKY